MKIFEITTKNALKEAIGEIASATQIYVDMDGVLADFFGEWAKLMQVNHFTDIDKQHDINDALQKIRDTDDFWLRLPILPEAKNLLNLIKQVKGEYSICTSPLADDPNSEKHKRTWVEKNLAFFPPKEVFVTHNKPQFATAKDGTPNILIDDYGVNINAWEAAGGIGFKYKDHKFERTANDIKQHMDVKEGYQLKLERDEEIDVLHIMDTKTKKRIEVRGKKGYETNGYDPQDKLHQVLDKVGRSANISELMNGKVVGINPKHPQGADAEKTAKDVLTTEKQRLDPKCWKGYRKDGTQMKNGVRVNKCVKVKEDEYTWEGDLEMLYDNEEMLDEAEYQGRKVKLGKPMQGDVKKFKVYVKNPKGNVVKVNFGDPNMRIKKSNPKRRKSFRARHNCDSPGPRHKARYWSCRKW